MSGGITSALIDAYHSVAGDDLPALKPAGLNSASERIELLDAKHARIQDFAPIQGWLCFQSSVRWFTDGELPDDGRILYGEMFNERKASLHIRQDSDGACLVCEYTRTEEPHLLYEEVRLLGEKADIGLLNYEVFWALDKKYGFRRIASRFTGFRHADQETDP